MTPVRILIVDDTIVYRSILRGVIEALPGCTVVGTAQNGAVALEALAKTPADIVLLDVEMPVMNGIETLRAIRERFQDVSVIMVSAANRSAADITIQALELGALDFVPKPETGDPAKSRASLIETLGQIIETHRRSRSAVPGPAHSPAAASPPPMRVGRSKVDVVTIGISTGGPSALTQVIPALPKDLGVPVLIVQHMPPLFTESLARNLDRQSALAVSEGVEGEVLGAGHVYIAPGGKHMVIRRRPESGVISIGVNENPPENNCRPAADVLFRSVAAVYGKNALAVVMTGMGSDGCEGARVIRRQGGMVLAQEETTCVIYGMPRAVIEGGLADEVVALNEVAKRIVAHVRGTEGAGV